MDIGGGTHRTKPACLPNHTQTGFVLGPYDSNEKIADFRCSVYYEAVNSSEEEHHHSILGYLLEN